MIFKNVFCSFLTLVIFAVFTQAQAHEDHEAFNHATFIPIVIEQTRVKIFEDVNYRYVEGNGIPNHETGRFPNAGNPNAISSQNLKYRVSVHPQKSAQAKSKRGIVGVALNGIPFEPGTAEYWNRDRSSGLNYEALSGKINLGLDRQNAHVQPTGKYHYHGIPKALINGELTHVGYAADGFPFYVSRLEQYKPSYRLKSGTRSNGPGGAYDGTFTSDYEYVAGAGDLDECNGTMINGKYAYVLTEGFPHIPRCLWGNIDPSFEDKGAGRKPPPHNRGRGGHHRPPPRF